MENELGIKDIITTDEDRLFIVDPECYIIFTGVSADDIQPFIRIGNWYDLPVELIPLVENIIVTDGVIGNPSIEQFNIDITRLDTNRYIGSKNIMKRFLEYQGLFGVKLNRATLVEVERDIPELSREKNISEKYQFIGVFYRDGNFKTVYNGKPLVDLNRLKQETISYNSMFDSITEKARKKGHYGNSGVVILDHNPAFFHRGSFYTYLFPSNYIESFSGMFIQPDRIQAVFLPSDNLINLSNFLKWKNSRESKVRLYHDKKQNVDTIRKLFPKATISHSDFNDFTLKADKDFTIQNYRDSYNLKCAYRNTVAKEPDLPVAYVKSRKGIEEVLKDTNDLILIQYSAYEDSSLLFKSNETPVAIIDDGNPNVRKLWGKDFTILYPENVYEFHHVENIEDCISLINVNTDMYAAFNGSPEDWTRETLASLQQYGTLSESDIIYLYNLKFFIRLLINVTKNRHLSSELKDLHRELEKKLIDLRELENSIIHMKLIIYDKNIYQGVSSISKYEPLFLDSFDHGSIESAHRLAAGTRSFYERIIHDRERLARLLAVFRQSSINRAENEAVTERLKKAMEERKQIFRSDIDFDINRVTLEEPPGSGAQEDASPGAETEGDAGRKKRMVIGALAGLVLVVLLLISGIYFDTIKSHISGTGPSSDDGYFDKKKIQEMNLGRNITINDNVIYEYANAVALKNGYKPIARYENRVKNPDWIYPGNVFVMLDGQKVIVRDGDTLWDLAKYKLIQMKIEFDALTEQARGADNAERSALLEKAKRLAFTGEQKSIIKELMPPGKSETGEQQQRHGDRSE